MTKACKFCHFVNSFICDDFEDCVGCGRCKPPMPKDPAGFDDYHGAPRPDTNETP